MGAGVKYTVPSSTYSNTASTNHIIEAPQNIKQSKPNFMVSCGRLLYHSIVHIIAAKIAVSNVI
jgi:hypothetical protein